MVGQLLHQGQILFETLDFNIFLKHFDQTLHDELLEEFTIDCLIVDFSGEGIFDFLLDPFDELVPEFHFGHAGLIDFSAFHDFEVGF